MTPLVLASIARRGGRVSAGSFSGAADFASRSSGAFFVENFNYADLNAASSHSTNPKFYGSSTGNPPSSSIMSINAGGPSAKYLRIKFPPNSGGAGYSWLYTFDDNDGVQVPFTGVAHDDFFFQCVLRMDQHLDFPFRNTDHDMASPKMFIIDKHNSSSNPGEVVCTNDHMRGFVQFYVGFTPSHGSQLLSRSINTPQGTPDFRAQNAVDTGSPSSPSTMDDYRSRYGPFTSDTPSFTTGSITGSSSLAAAGWPQATSATAGVAWLRNEWMVVTVYVYGAANTVKVWASKYGDPPKLICDTAQINFGGALDMGRGSTGYPGFQLTPFITGNANAAGASQPETWIDYSEIIASNNPIQHPGGYSLPGSPR